MRMRKKSHEKLSSDNIARVIELLEADKPITKKEACEILNIAYNTTRLQKIIDHHKEIEDFAASRRAANRGKAATPDEIRTVVTEYLSGDSVTSIANGLFRSVGFVKAIIQKIGVPSRAEETINGVDVLPDQCVSDSFELGEYVWSATYQTLAVIEQELTQEYLESRKGLSNIDYQRKYSSKMYSIYVLDNNKDYEDTLFPGVTVGGFQAYAPAYELGSLKHLESLGIDLGKL